MKDCQKANVTEMRIAELKSLNEQSIGLAMACRGHEAEESFRKAVAISGKYTEEVPEVFLPYHATTIHNLAKFLHDEGGDVEAERLHRKALALRRSIAFGDADANAHFVASSLEGLALVLASTGRRREAEPLYREAIEIRRNIAEEHPRATAACLASTLNNLGALLREEGRLAEAEAFCSEAVTIQRKLVELNPEVFLGGLSRKLINLADVLKGGGRTEEAEPLYEEAASLRGVGGVRISQSSTCNRDIEESMYARGAGKPCSDAPTWSALEGHAPERRLEKRNVYCEVIHPLQPWNGLGHAYRYKDHETGDYELTARETDAVILGLNIPQTVWVVFRDGEIDHAATADEYQCELERRIGERISEGFTPEEIAEFDVIEERAEEKRWLEENRPDYPDIVVRTITEMKKAAVLDDVDEYIGKTALGVAK